MIQRKGKIAHLPRHLRDELSQRIDNGVPGPELLAWLNAEPDVKEILDQYFVGHPITKQNLSEWRQGGYQDWVKLQETRDLTLQLAEQPEDLDLGLSARKISDSFATITAAEFARSAQARLRECTTTTQRWESICDIQTRLSRLRRDDYRASSLALNQDRWAHKLGAGKPAARAGDHPKNH
jgi:hypothetical protein